MGASVEHGRPDAILIGASEYPHSPALSNVAFKGAATEIRTYLCDPTGLGIASERVLDLFDSNDSVADQCARIRQFVERSAASATILFYVGHGAYTREKRQYCLILRTTRSGLESSTALRLDALVEALEPAFMRPFFGFLDCCFAGDAAKEFQGSHDELAMKQLDQRLPSRGTALLVATSKDDVAIAARTEGNTRFTTALMSALSRASPDRSPFTLRELHRGAALVLRERWPNSHAVPEIHSPRQQEGDVADLPFFPPRPGRGHRSVPLPKRAPRRRDHRDEPPLQKSAAFFPMLFGVGSTSAAILFLLGVHPPQWNALASAALAGGLTTTLWAVLRSVGMGSRVGGPNAEVIVASVGGLGLWILAEFVLSLLA